MEALVSGLEKLLWFIYRVFFTLVPPLVFISLCFGLLKYNDPNLANKVFSSFSELGSFKGWIILAFAFILNVLAESIGSVFINFREQIKDDLSQTPIYVTLLAKVNSELKSKVLTDEKELVITDLGFARLLMIQKFAQISNFFWFFYVSYKISTATNVFINLLILLYLPFTICTQFNLWGNNGNWCFFLLQGLQLSITCLSMYGINKFVKEKKQPGLKSKIVIIISIGLAAAFLFGISTFLPLSGRVGLLVIALNLLIFPLSVVIALLSYNQNWLTYRTLADVLMTLKYGETVFGKDMFPASEPPKPAVK